MKYALVWGQTVRLRLESTGGMDGILYYINGGLSIALVLFGGLFAGLTLALVLQGAIRGTG